MPRMCEAGIAERALLVLSTQYRVLSAKFVANAPTLLPGLRPSHFTA
jgi:hypothetical protein